MRVAGKGNSRAGRSSFSRKNKTVPIRPRRGTVTSSSRFPVNKTLLIGQIVSQLELELERYSKAARVAHAEATDEQSRAENKYDTRGLEASYLAQGQSRQVIETEQAREQYLALAARRFDPAEPIGVGALIELESNGERLWYFLGPAAGGTEVLCDGQEVLVVTPPSPLGRMLMGECAGATPALSGTTFRVCSVS